MAALRDAQFIVPVRPGPEMHFILLDLDGVRHVAVFTSAQLARHSAAQYLGADTAEWTNATYRAGELTKTFAIDQHLLVDPGSPLQGTFTPSDMVVHQPAGAPADSAPSPASASRSASAEAAAPAVGPRTQRGSIRNGLWTLVMGVALLIIGFNLATGPVTCGSQIMEAGDTCVVTSNGNSMEQTFAQTQRSQNRLTIGSVVAGGGLTIAGIYLSGRASRRPPAEAARPDLCHGQGRGYSRCGRRGASMAVVGRIGSLRRIADGVFASRLPIALPMTVSMTSPVTVVMRCHASRRQSPWSSSESAGAPNSA